MTLPSTGILTAEMINAELGRSAKAAINLNDPAVRALAGKPTGAISFSDLRGKSSEIVYKLTDTSIDRMDQCFNAADWASDTLKRIIIPNGTDFGHASRNYALAVGLSSGGQAGSFNGRLILELEAGAFLSGRGGVANGGVGGDALYANLLGRNGQKLEVINKGTIRAGGGGGGLGGKGGAGGGGSTTSTVREPASGDQQGYDNGTTFYFRAYNDDTLRWNNTLIASNFNGAVGSYYDAEPNKLIATIGGYSYYVGTKIAMLDGNPFEVFVSIYRTSTTTTNTNGGAGGSGGNGGRGQGFGQALAAGSTGAAGANGGASAGKGGTGGTGGAGGGWGAAGAKGNNGGAGANGNRTNGGAGATGANGGAAGCYVNGNANVTWTQTGTRQGRVV